MAQPVSESGHGGEIEFAQPSFGRMLPLGSSEWDRLAARFEQLCDLPSGELEDRLAGLEEDESFRRELAAMLEAHRGGDELRVEELLNLAEGQLAAGEVRSVGGYRLLSLLGEGGMGEVWLAQREDPEFPQKVALKRIRRGWPSEDLKQRFAVEREALARLSHRGIALLLDGGIDAGVPYLVLEYVEGERFTDSADARRLSIEARLDLFLEVCEAVSYAHANLVVHRDLKPSNILVSESGEVRLLDFGIAKLLDTEAGPRGGLTRTAQYLATPEYASPEQLLGGPITTATDVYALGVLLFELLVGRRPFPRQEPTWNDLVRAVQSETASSPAEALGALDATEAFRIAAARATTSAALRRAVGGDLGTIVAKALQPEPERRYPSVDRLAEDLRLFRQGRPIWAQPDSFTYLAGKFVRRHRGAAAAAAAFLLLLSGFLGYAWRQSGILAEQRDEARWERDNARQVSDFVTHLFTVDPYAGSEGFRDTTTLGEFLETSEGNLRRELRDRPQLLAALLSRLARFHGNLGHLSQARDLAEEALALRRETPGTLPTDLAYTLVTLGTVRQAEGRWAEAEALFRESLALREEVHDPVHPEVAESVQNLAVVLLEAGDPARTQELEGLVRRSVDLRRELFGEDHLDTAQSLNALATFLLGRAEGDDLMEAEQIYRRIAQIRESQLGSGHPTVGTVKNNLANLLDDLDREDEAIPLFEEAISTWRGSLGAEHPRVASGLYGLAEARWDHGDLEGAERDLRASLAIDEASLPPGHPFLAGSWLRLGELLLERGRPAEARVHLHRAAQAFGEDQEVQRQRAVTALEALGAAAERDGGV